MRHNQEQPHRPATPPRAHLLPDGSTLCAPEPRTARELRIGWWIRVDKEPRCIVDMRSTGGNGRVVHLEGRTARPLRLAATDTVPVYRVVKAPTARAAGGPDAAARRP